MNLFLHPFRCILFLCFFCITTGVKCYADEIHVATTGTDALTGRGTEATPYKTINFIFKNGLINTGDVIIVHKGTYRETITVNTSGITIKPYENDVVTISGADLINASAWSNDGGGIFSTTLNSSDVETDFTQLFVNGKLQQIARYPNNTTSYKDYIVGSNQEMLDPLNQQSGFAILLNASKPSGADQKGVVTFSEHEGTPVIPAASFTDEAIIRGFIGKLRNNIFCYSQEGGEVTKTSDREVSFISEQTQGNNWAANAAYSAPEGFGYIMDLSVLDYPGEWFFKKKSNKLYYMPKGGNLNGKTLEVKKRKYALKIRANNVKIENINVKAATMDVQNSNGLTVDHCTFTYLFPYHYRQTYGVLREGIVLKNSDNTTFESSYIGHTWGSGIIILDGSDNSTINNCIIEDIGWMGQFTISLENNGDNTKVTNNTFGRASRFHIRTTESVYAEITDNDFYGAMEMGEDAGAIMYTSTGKAAELNLKGSILAYNKLHDMDGIPAYDTDPAYKRQKVVGFYLEDVDNYTAHHNIVYNLRGNTYTSKRLQSNGQPEYTESKGQVMYLGPRNRDLTRKINYYNNTFWNYDYFLTFWNHDGGGVRDLDLKNNIIEPGKANEINAQNADNVASTNLNTFATAASAAPLSYGIELATNESPTNPDTHFINTNNANFRLKGSSPYNNGGTVISGITSSSDPAIGAYEGDTNADKERVFNAGSNLTTDSFNTESTLSTFHIDKKLAAIKVYPNPTKTQVNIDFDTDLITSEDQFSIKLMNIAGSTIMNKKVDNTNEIISVNAQSLASGLYLLEIKTKNSSTVHKIIKQ